MNQTQNIANLGENRVAKLRYLLLSGRDASPEHQVYHDSAYQLWQRNWLETFKELKSEAKLRADDFMRQDIITALFDGDRAVGLLLHTYINLDLNAIRDHTYLSTYPSSIIEQLRTEGSARVLSMEYLTLDEKWRKSQVGVALAPVILGLGAKVFEASNFAAMIVVTRNDKQVNKILYGYGARCLTANLTKHNVAVDLVSLDKGKTHPGKDPEVNRWIEHFWERRMDTVKVEEFQNRLQKAA